MADYPDESHIVKIISTEHVTHDVKRFTLSKPPNYIFTPGQATDITINETAWLNERRPFTFTGLNEWENLEFTIKIYPQHKGVTNELGQLQKGDTIILHDVWGAIHYKGEGTFIAGGAGVTPFIAIFRLLEQEGKIGKNTLIFSNKTERDIILKNDFERILGKNFINTLTEEKSGKYDHRKIDLTFLKEKISNLSQYFYICGPDPMIESIVHHLKEMGVEDKWIVKEEF